jgi:Na+-driven multidrug efflux pump
MFVRSMVLQTTFFVALVAASRLGTDTLAAHSIIHQLWILISYAVDGFAAAGIVLGSRLAAQAHDPLCASDAKFHLRRLIRTVLCAGLAAGVAACIAFGAAHKSVVALFTASPGVALLLDGGAWWVLTAAQPINSLVFIYDGLMYSSGHFEYIRNYIFAGFALVFCPVLALQLVAPGLTLIWAAKAAYNVWRLGGAIFLIHYLFMQEFDAQLVDGGEV